MTEEAPITRKPLTHTRQIDTAKPEKKTYGLNAGEGLFLEVLTTGAKRWRYSYSFAGKRGLLSVGTYSAVGLADAKAKHDEYNRLLAQGISPSDQRKQEKQDAKQSDQLRLYWSSMVKRPRRGSEALHPHP